EDPGGSVGTSTTDDSPTATAASELDVVAADFLGRPAGQVAAELEDLGLRVEMRPSPGGGQVGTVKQVSPTGTVEAGSLVTLGVVAPDRSDEDGQGDESKPGKGKGRQKHGGNGDGEGDD
ncbi:MAG: PASTA domain-containing protein, partial [Actinomycetes bacterium]